MQVLTRTKDFVGRVCGRRRGELEAVLKDWIGADLEGFDLACDGRGGHLPAAVIFM